MTQVQGLFAERKQMRIPSRDRLERQSMEQEAHIAWCHIRGLKSPYQFVEQRRLARSVVEQSGIDRFKYPMMAQVPVHIALFQERRAIKLNGGSGTRMRRAFEFAKFPSPPS
jgi:hypothetical protein